MKVSAGKDNSRVCVDGDEIYFKGLGAGSPSIEAAAVLGVISSLVKREPLEVEGEISAETLLNLEQVSAVFSTWMNVPRQPIRAGIRASSTPQKGGAASFFSGGVDSFHTAMTRPDVTALIFVHGFDIPLEDAKLRKQASDNAREAAAELGKDFIEVETDLRRYGPYRQTWGMTHGAAMAAIAHLLADRFGTVYIPATYTYADSFPWGSHPMSDPLWSGDRTRIVHYGADTTRFEKIGALAHNETAAKHLRVCWQNLGGRFNCCHCEKCTRTMIALRAHGVLDKFVTFDRPLELNRVRFGMLNHQTQIAFTKQGLEAVRSNGDAALASALRWRLMLGPKTFKARSIAGSVKRRLKQIVLRTA